MPLDFTTYLTSFSLAFTPSGPLVYTNKAELSIQVFNLDTGFYLFPPNPDGLIKLAVHDKGVSNPPSGKEGTSAQDTSVPRTKLTPGAEDGMIPRRMLKTLRRELRRVYPELGEKDFVYTRLCWYVYPSLTCIPEG